MCITCVRPPSRISSDQKDYSIFRLGDCNLNFHFATGILRGAHPLYIYIISKYSFTYYMFFHMFQIRSNLGRYSAFLQPWIWHHEKRIRQTICLSAWIFSRFFPLQFSFANTNDMTEFSFGKTRVDSTEWSPHSFPKHIKKNNQM